MRGERLEFGDGCQCGVGSRNREAALVCIWELSNISWISEDTIQQRASIPPMPSLDAHRERQLHHTMLLHEVFQGLPSVAVSPISEPR